MKKLFIASILLSFVFTGCGGGKKTVTSKKETKTEHKTKPDVVTEKTETTELPTDLDFNIVKYIARYRNIAKKEMKEYGIPASITLAQGILESQGGKSRLAVEGNNHFGIKCHKDWQGKKIFHDDEESQECFRKYVDAEQSFKDHSKFLAYRKRYAFLFRLPKTDYEAWAQGLKKAGYATDPSYPEKLVYIIEKYRLNTLDKDVLNEMSVKIDDVKVNNGPKKKKFIYEVKEGETIFTIARKFDIPVKDIQSTNNLNDFDIYEGQILVLTENSDAVQQPDNTSNQNNIIETPDNQNPETINNNDTTVPDTSVPTVVENNNPNMEKHTVKQGETLFSIAQSYRIDLSDLKEANGLTGNNIDVGSVIYIPKDKIKPVAVTPKPTQTETSVAPVTTVQTDKHEYHIVQPGETLYRIHINYGVPIYKLRKWNHIKGNFIKVGQKLRVK